MCFNVKNWIQHVTYEFCLKITDMLEQEIGLWEMGS